MQIGLDNRILCRAWLNLHFGDGESACALLWVSHHLVSETFQVQKPCHEIVGQSGETKQNKNAKLCIN